MCVANLNVALQPCSHRWYKLVRSCSPSSNLANCPQKLKLEGWETRNEHCPFCAADAARSRTIDDTTHKLFGNMSRQGSYSSAMASVPRERSRANSTSTSTTSRSSSRGSENGADLDRGEEARIMNRRLETYLSAHPSKMFSNRGEEKERLSDEDIAPKTVPLSRSSSALGKGFKRSIKISRSMFRS